MKVSVTLLASQVIVKIVHTEIIKMKIIFEVENSYAKKFLFFDIKNVILRHE